VCEAQANHRAEYVQEKRSCDDKAHKHDIGQKKGSSKEMEDPSMGCIESNWRGLPARLIFRAMRNGVDELCRVLQEGAHPVNGLDGDGWGILHHIAACDVEAASCMIELLISHGGCDGEVDIELRNRHLETPLILAALNGNVQVVKCLLWHGARADVCDCSGDTALSRASGSYGNVSDMPPKSRALLVKMLTDAVEQQKESKGAAATRLREAGNVAFQNNMFTQAHGLYTESLEMWQDYRTYANRAATYLKLGVAEHSGLLEASDSKDAEMKLLYSCAASDAARAIEMQPDFPKAFYRQSKAYVGLRNFPRARLTVERGLRACPGNQPLLTLLNDLISIGVYMYVFMNVCLYGMCAYKCNQPLHTLHSDIISIGAYMYMYMYKCRYMDIYIYIYI